MKIVSPSFEIFSFTPDLEKVIERAGRTCYKSEGKITDTSYKDLIARLKASKHESVLEHGAITVRIVCDRGVSHELVRHRIVSFSQESTRYCNYSKDKFGSEITVIRPCYFTDDVAKRDEWRTACEAAERSYFVLLGQGATPQEARSVLPNSLKTEIVMTANPREWMWIFEKRCDQTAHPSMREIMIPMREAFRAMWPSIFGQPA